MIQYVAVAPIAIEIAIAISSAYRNRNFDTLNSAVLYALSKAFGEIQDCE